MERVICNNVRGGKKKRGKDFEEFPRLRLGFCGGEMYAIPNGEFVVFLLGEFFRGNSENFCKFRKFVYVISAIFEIFLQFLLTFAKLWQSFE